VSGGVRRVSEDRVAIRCLGDGFRKIHCSYAGAKQSGADFAKVLIFEDDLVLGANWYVKNAIKVFTVKAIEVRSV
jgi:hypothetical protein